MGWLVSFGEHAEVGRRRYEQRLSEIEGLPRGEFLRHKRDLLNEPTVAFWRSTSPSAGSRAIDELGLIPDELRALLNQTDGIVNLVATRQMLELQIFGVEGIRQYKAMAADLVVRDELFPPVFRKLLIFGNDFGHRLLATWVDDTMKSVPVLLVDTEKREILVISHSFGLFFQRVAFALSHEIPFRIGARSQQLREFITRSEPGPTYPPKLKGQTQFLFDDVGGFPRAWQSLLSEGDRSFRLD